jgi:hypothetical protein
MAYQLNYVNEYTNPAAANMNCVETDGTYLYVGDDTGNLYALTWDGSSYTLVQTLAVGSTIRALRYDGTYLHVGFDTALANNLRAYTFDGANFSLEAQADDLFDVYCIYYDGTYIYTGDNSGRVDAYSFNGTTYSHIDDLGIGGANPVVDITGDGTYLYAVDDNGDDLHAMSFDGITLNSLDIVGLGNEVNCVCVHNGYVIVGMDAIGGDIRAYTFDGVNLAVEDTYALNNTEEVISDGTYVFAIRADGLLYAFTFDGTFIAASSIDLIEGIGGVETKKMVILDNYIHSCHDDDTLKATQMSLQANIAATPTSGRAPLTVQFQGS